MIRGFLISQATRVHSLCSHNVSRRLYNSINSNFSSQDFDISDELLEIISDPSKSKKTFTEFSTRRVLQRKFKHFLDCTEEEALRAVDSNKKLMRVPVPKITAMIELLLSKNVTSRTILENSYLLAMPSKYVEEKIALLAALPPNDINDVIPLIRLSPLQIMKLQKTMEKERDTMPEGNRINYMAKRLNVKPALVSKYFATHLFMFDISFLMLVENLNVMLEYEIAAIDILRDLWAFKYFASSIRARLDRCKKADKKVLKPWMIRCQEETLQRTLELSQEKKNLLGEKTTEQYLSERLGYDIETMKNIVRKHPQVLNVRVTRIKEMLDYLLIEEKFQPFEVASVIRILCHKLETTRDRIEELKSFGCRPTSLVIVCKSQIEYRKFLDSWIEHKNKTK